MGVGASLSSGESKSSGSSGESLPTVNELTLPQKVELLQHMRSEYVKMMQKFSSSGASSHQLVPDIRHSDIDDLLLAQVEIDTLLVELQEAKDHGPVSMADISRGVQAIFDRYDVDHSGTIGSSEFKQMMQECIAEHGGSFTVSDEEIERFMAHMDRDGNGVLELDEFIGFVIDGLCASPEDRSEFATRSDMHRKLSEMLLIITQSVANSLGKGQLMGKSLFDQLPDIMMQRIRKAVDQLFSRYDADGSGSIDVEEFTVLIEDTMRSHGDSFPSSLNATIFVQLIQAQVRHEETASLGSEQTLYKSDFVEFAAQTLRTNSQQRLKFSSQSRNHHRLMNFFIVLILNALDLVDSALHEQADQRAKERVERARRLNIEKRQKQRRMSVQIARREEEERKSNAAAKISTMEAKTATPQRAAFAEGKTTADPVPAPAMKSEDNDGDADTWAEQQTSGPRRDEGKYAEPSRDVRDEPEGKTSKVEQEQEEEEREQRQQEKEQVESIVPDGGSKESEGVISRADDSSGVDRAVSSASHESKVGGRGEGKYAEKTAPGAGGVEDNNNFGPLEESRVVDFIAYLWDLFDEDGDDALDAAEFSKMLGAVTSRSDVNPDECLRFLRQMDSSGDDKIQRDELQQFAMNGFMLSVEDAKVYSRRSRMHELLVDFLQRLHDRIKAGDDAQYKRLQRAQVCIKEIWLRYDTNKDGYLDAGELQKLMEEVMVWDGDSEDHPTEDEAARFINSMDEDGNGLLDQEEFVQFIRQCLAMDDDMRISFAARSPMHAKLMIFANNVLEKVW